MGLRLEWEGGAWGFSRYVGGDGGGRVRGGVVEGLVGKGMRPWEWG